MAKTIWKFGLNTTDRQIVKMPAGSEILSIQTQAGEPCIWALVDPSAEKEDRVIEIFGTGHPIHYDMGIERKFIGTYQISGGVLVFHAFERL